MARTSRRKSSIDPAQRTLSYIITPSSGAVTVDIDLAKDLSAVNRRLYRQGMQYYVSGVSFLRLVPGVSSMTCMTAGDTWMVHNAWKKGFQFWKAQQKDVSGVLPGIQGKWADFKIELDDNSGTAINTVASDGGTIVPDEWDLSNYVWDDDGTERFPTFVMLGSTATGSKVGLVQEYHISRAQQADEPTISADASDSIYAKSLGTDEMSDLLVGITETENDAPPYDANEMAGGDTVADCPHLQSFDTAFFESGSKMTHGFTVECGLLRLALGSFGTDGTTPSDVAHLIQVHLAPGPYKGVMASPMGQ